MFYEDLSPYAYFEQTLSGIAPSSHDSARRWIPEEVPQEWHALPQLNVGWLEPPHPMPTGESPSGFTERLLRLCKFRSINRYRGYHVCGYCALERSEMWPMETTIVQGKQMRLPMMYCARMDEHKAHLGSAEIWVEHRSGVIFVAPNLIYHYVKDHGYRPPDLFLEAVMEVADMGLTVDS